MSLKERVSNFLIKLDDILGGPDTKTDEGILDEPGNKALKESLENAVREIEEKYSGEEGHSDKIVNRAKVDTSKAAEKAAKKAEQRSTEPKAMDGEER